MTKAPNETFPDYTDDPYGMANVMINPGNISMGHRDYLLKEGSALIKNQISDLATCEERIIQQDRLFDESVEVVKEQADKCNKLYARNRNLVGVIKSLTQCLEDIK